MIEHVDKRLQKTVKKALKDFQNIANKHGCEIKFSVNDKPEITIAKPEKKNDWTTQPTKENEMEDREMSLQEWVKKLATCPCDICRHVNEDEGGPICGECSVLIKYKTESKWEEMW